MLDLEIRNKMINKLSAALVPELGLPVDIIERALKKAFKKISEDNYDNAFDNSSFPSPSTPSTPSTPTLPTNIHNDLQVLKPVNELSRGLTFNPSDSNYNYNSHIDDDLKNKNQQEVSSQKNRKDSYSSLIEITQSGSTSINVKLPNLYATQDELNNQNINHTNSINENSIRPGYSDENNVYNNKNMMQNRQMDSIHNDFNSNEYIPPQQRESLYIQTNRVQNNYTSYTPEVQSWQIDSENIPRRKDSQETYNYISESERQQRESIANQVEDFEFDSVPPRSSEYINNEPSDPYKSDSDNSCAYNSQIHTSHQQPNSRHSRPYSSEWPTPSEATKKGDPKKNTEVDLGAWGQITSAWGKPKKWSSETEIRKPEPKPANTWNPNDVNHTWSPIQESKAPLFKKKKNAPVNFEFDDNEGWGPHPTKYTPWEDDEKQGYCFDLIQEQKQTVFWTKQNDVWVNVSEEVKITQVERSSNGNQRDVRQTRTQTQRIERQGQGQGNGREQIEAETENIVIDLTDDETSSNSAKSIRELRERPGNPQWKTEEEWLSHNHASGEEHSTSDKDENENWDYYPRTKEESVDTVKDDTWSSEDIMSNEQEDMINEPEQNLLINVDPNSDNITSESTIINTHPPIYHGIINNTVTDSNDIILDYTTSANMTSNMNVTNNSELNLLSFEDEEDNNKVLNSSDNLTSIENQPQESAHSYNIEDLEAYLENNRAIQNGVNEDNKHEAELTNHSNELQSADTDNYESSRYMPSYNDTSSSKTYYYDDSSQPNIEPITSSSALDVEGKDDERVPYTTNGYESSRFVPSLNSPTDTPSSKLYYYEDSSQPNIEPTTFDGKGRDDERKGSNNDKSNSKSDYMINITVETPSDGRQILRLRLDDDPQAKTAEFCRKWGMTNFEDALEGLVQKEKRKRLRKRKNKWCAYND